MIPGSERPLDCPREHPAVPIAGGADPPAEPQVVLPKRYFDFKRLEPRSGLWDSVQALRYDVYGLECKYLDPAKYPNERETDENDLSYVLPSSRKGKGLDAVWSDDFHHAVHAHFTGERAGYYQDFGEHEQIAKALLDLMDEDMRSGDRLIEVPY